MTKDLIAEMMDDLMDIKNELKVIQKGMDIGNFNKVRGVINETQCILHKWQKSYEACLVEEDEQEKSTQIRVIIEKF